MKKIIFLMILAIFSFNFACANEENLNLTIEEKLPNLKTNKNNKEQLTGNWAPYMRYLETRIKRNWKAPRKDSSTRIIVEFTISKQGYLLGAKIKQSGGDESDKAAINAIKKSAPFPPLPKEYAKDSVPILFTFDYNVMNSSKEHYNYAQETKFARSIREYKEQVQGKITKTYSKEKPLLNREDIKISIDINKHGEITNYKLIKSSQNEKIDEQALNIIKKASPFGILTTETNTETINVNYTFRKQP